jgi:hypothetical protein
MSRRLALLIGNVHYQDGRLHAPVSGKTFTTLADALESPTIGGFDEVFVSVNKPAVEAQLAIAEFLEFSHAPDDVLLLYFAGHALYHQSRPYLACADTFTAGYLDATTIQADYVRRRFSLHPSRHKLLILDCSASAMLAGDTLPTDEGWLGQAFQAVGVQVVAAAHPYLPASPYSSPLTPGFVEALRTGQARLNAPGLAGTAALLHEIAIPSISALTAMATPVVEAEELLTETAAPEGEPLFAEAVTDTPTATDVPTEIKAAPPAATADTLPGPAPLSEESEVVEPAVMVRVDEKAAAAASAPPEQRNFRRYALVALVLLLLLLAAGGLAGRHVGWLTAVAPADTPTTAAVAHLPTDEPTPSPTRTAAPTIAPTSTAHSNPTATNTAVPATPSPAPSPSPTRLITPSPTPVEVQIERQLVFMRSGPAINFRIVAYLTQGTAVTVLGRTESGDWYNVQLADGRTGWIYSQMAAALAGSNLAEIPLVSTLPTPANEFYDFVVQPVDDGLTMSVGHVYVGTAGAEGTFQATLLPETEIIQPTYENGQALGLGDFVVHWARVAEGEYSSTAVQLCMLSSGGEPFFCQTFPLRRTWAE